MKVFAANPVIMAMLEERGALLGGAPLEHSYPHCWRCHHPSFFALPSSGSFRLRRP